MSRKQRLLATAALIGTGVAQGSAMAADGIKLNIGGYFNQTYMVNIDDDGENEAGDERNTDGFFNDAEIYFSGEVTLDNGLTVSARIELEGETDDDQIDEAWMAISGGFGQARFGSIDDALAYNCVLPPGGTANFSAFSPDQWAANSAITNPACIGVDETSGGDAQKLLYFSPVFSGFQLSLSYTPDGAAQDYNEGAGPHLGMTTHEDDESRHNFSTYLTYSYEGDGWGATIGGGGSWEGKVEGAPGSDRKKQEFYQGGVSFTFGDFSIGGVFEYFNHALDRTHDSDVGESVALDAWTAGGGIAYAIDAWTLGAQYSHLDADNDGSTGFSDFTQDRAMVTAVYSVGPGIDLDAEVAYTWVDTDPESFESEDGTEIDGYDALEIGIGTALTF